MHYNLSHFDLTCPICKRKAKSEKALVDHIFHRNWKDQKHKEFSLEIRKKAQEDFIKQAKHTCHVCNEKFLRTLATHFKNKKDVEHQRFMKKREKRIISLFISGNSPLDIEKEIGMNNKWVWRILQKRLGKAKAKEISNQIISRKRKERWASISTERRKELMQPVRDAEWANLTEEQRKNHPWVKAGRKASLRSSKKGSKNQQYAYELLSQKLRYIDWDYNYVLKEEWQIDIAAPKRKIFIEWDGRHHRIPIHGQRCLNNRKNRDRLKDRIVTDQLNATMIRVQDNGRFDPEFVQDVTNEIVELIENTNLKNKVYLI